MKATLGIIGLDRELQVRLADCFEGRIVFHDCLPKFIVNDNVLYIEKPKGIGFVKIDILVFHGIFENDLDFITALTFWNGPCFPNPFGMMNCRLKLPCLSRALRISKYGAMRGMIDHNVEINTSKEMVAKWGNWHCGENKDKFIGKWKSSDVSVLEPFFQGEAVRVVMVGSAYLQIKMTGDNWLKSIHHNDSEIMAVDDELLEDTTRLKESLNLDMIANDYIVSSNGEKYLLEVNHIPNMTRFIELQDSYVNHVNEWIEQLNIDLV